MDNEKLLVKTLPHVIQFSVNPGLVPVVDYDGYRASNHTSWDIPGAEVIAPTAEAIVHVITANGFQPEDLVLSGYDRFESQASAEKFKQETHETTDSEHSLGNIDLELRAILRELNDLEEQGRLAPSKRSLAKARIRELHKQRAELRLKPIEAKQTPYFFAETSAMFNNLQGNNNPLFYSGASAGSTIGIYDRWALARMASNSNDAPGDYDPTPEQIYEVRLTIAQLELAKVLEGHVHYGSYQSYSF